MIAHDSAQHVQQSNRTKPNEKQYAYVYGERQPGFVYMYTFVLSSSYTTGTRYIMYQTTRLLFVQLLLIVV